MTKNWGSERILTGGGNVSNAKRKGGVKAKGIEKFAKVTSGHPEKKIYN